jgi:hypothetical protein
MAVLGAMLHWAKKAYRGETNWNPLDYWLADHPAHSAGSIGALVAAVWGVVFSDSLTGMKIHMVIASGFTIGWMIDSGFNKAAASSSVNVQPGKQSGYARLDLLLVIALAFALIGCATPQTFNQRLLVGYETVAETRTQTATLLNGRLISSADAENVQQQANLAREGLDIAKGMRSTQPQAAEQKLSSMQTVISALKAYLMLKEGAK